MRKSLRPFFALERFVHHLKLLFWPGLLGGVFFLSLLACSATPTVEETIAPEDSPTPTYTQAATDSPLPSPTAEAGLVILLTPPGSDPTQAASMEDVFSELAAGDGMRFVKRDQLSVSEIGPEVSVVIVIAPDPGVNDLAAASPETQFLAIGIPGVTPESNLSVVSSGGSRPDMQGFLAGYLAAVITPDWRVGVVSTLDTVEGRAARLGFQNGVIFYCGLCRPAYPPFLQYPVTVELPTEPSPDEQKAASDTMIANAVETVYVHPGAGGGALLDSLAEAGITLIGGASPPADLQSQWAASVSVDLIDALERVWPKIINGEGGITVDVPLTLSDQNPVLFSPGRQRLVEKLLAELVAGYIDTGVDPSTGELR